MSGRGDTYLVSKEPKEGAILEKNGYRYRVKEVFPRRGGVYRCRTRAIEGRPIEVWFTVQVSNDD